MLLLVSTYLFADSAERMSFAIRQLMTLDEAGRRGMGVTTDKICAFVRFQSGDAEVLLSQYGCEKVTQIGDIFIVNIPLSQLSAMAADESVERIETHVDGRQMLDVTPQWVNNLPVRTGLGLPQAYDGTGVLLGIIDGGFDLTHPSFYDMKGTTCRIKGFVDDYATDEETIGKKTVLGREYLTQEELMAKQHSGDAANHGTHCLGIAAGSGYGTNYKGIAYGADIFAVSSKNAIESHFANSADQTARVKRIFDYADEIGKPCVITYSIGFRHLPDDAVLYEEALSQLVGKGKVMVAAAGNDGDDYLYVEKAAGTPTAGSVMTHQSSKGKMFLMSEHPFKLKCLSPKSVSMTDMEMVDSVLFDTQHLSADSLVMRGHHIILEKTGSFYTLTDRINDHEIGTLGDYKGLAFAIEGDEKVQVLGERSFVNMPEVHEGKDTRFCQARMDYNIGMPGTLPSMVTIGALNGRASYVNSQGETKEGYGMRSPEGTLAFFSSKGPTFDGRIKPDAVAPGVNIISAGNSFCEDSYGTSMVTKTVFKGREYPWLAMSGTSMATPCAAGIITLWMQADPTLTPDRVKEILQKTCKHIDDEGVSPNNKYGHGLIDAYAGVVEILKQSTGIQTISSHQPTALRIRPADGQLSLQFNTAPVQPVSVKVYTVAGQLLMEQTLHPHGNTSFLLPVTNASKGIYIVQVNSSEEGLTGSEMIRF